jgi:lysophospholipid hydrolase
MRALRRSSLAFVPRTMMRVVTKLHPEAYAFIGRTVTRKMQAMFQHDAGGGSEGGSGPRKRSVAVIAASPNVALDAFCLTLKQALQSIGVSALVCSSLEVNAASTGLSRTGVPELLEEALALSKLNDLEDQHDVVLFKADPDASIWSRMCVAQADVVLFVCNGADRPMMSVLEMELRSSNPGVRRELVLLHVVAHHPSATGEAGGANAAAPGHTREWIEIIGDIAMHHQVRYHPYDPSKDVAHFKSDFRRVGRFLTGQAVGVVLGGGGARGAAHLAVLRALEEAQVPVDAVGGTSIGAFMGCLYSLKGADTLDMHGPFYRFAQEMASLWLKVRDLTFPIVSYVKGTQFNRMLVRVFGEVLIEDLWCVGGGQRAQSNSPGLPQRLNFFCITTDLTDSKQVVHRNGYAWKYVRASMTLTGFLPPMCDVGPDSRIHYLVDGGYVNVLPTDVMRQVVGDHGLVISVDVQAEWSLDGEDYGDDLNGWWFLWRRLLGRAPRIPTGSDIQSHLAYVSSVIQFGRAANEIKVDLSVAPPIKAFGMMQFEKVKEMQQLGFEYAVVAVKEWLAKLKASDEKRVRSFGATGPASRRMAVPPSRFSSSAALSLSQSQSLEHIVDFSIVANSAEESVDDMGGGAGDGVE